MKAIPGLLAGALCLAAFVPLVLPDDRVIDQPDYYSYQLPTREFVKAELLAGRFPLWIPYLGYGLPLHAGQQATICYPLLTPLLLVLPVNYAIRVAVFLHLVLAFCGMLCLARAFGLGRWPAALAAVIAVGGGYPAAHLNAGHITHLLEFALLPWFFVAVHWFLRKPGPWPCAALAVLGALFLFAGQPQLPYYALLFAGFWVVASLVRGEAARQRGKVLVWGGLAAVTAGLLVLVQLLPALELIRDGQEFSDRGSALRAGYLAMRPIDLLTLLQPNCMGNPYAGEPAFLDLEIAYHERAAYGGLAAVALVLLAVARRRRDPWEWGALALCLFSLVVALGNATPFFPVLGRLLPGLWAFRCPARILAVASLFYALLAGRGLEVLLTPDPEVNRDRLMYLTLGLLVLLVGYPLFVLQASGLVPQYLTYVAEHCSAEYLASGVVLAVAIGVLLTVRRMGLRYPELACFLVVAFTATDLWYFGGRHFEVVERPAEAAPPFPAEARLPVRFSEDWDEAWRYQYSELVEVAAHRGCPTPLTNEGAYLPAALHRLYVRLADQETSHEALAYSGTNYLYRREKKEWEATQGVLPRIRVEEPEDSVLSTQYDGRGTEPAGNAVAVQAENPQHLRLHVSAPYAGQLVIADTWYPGWVCQVDGVDVPIELAHGSFRSVRLSAGERDVEFTYRPASFRYGLIGSSAGLFLLIGLVAAGWWKPSRRSPVGCPGR